MFVSLLAGTLGVAIAVAIAVILVFDRPMATILRRILADDLADAWHRYVRFATIVVGVSSGVRIWDLEKYILPGAADAAAIVLNADRWTLEVYRTMIGTLAGIAYLQLVFFGVALIACAVLRGLGTIRDSRAGIVAAAGGPVAPR